jgi:4,5-dihydroxyphthalate decarboxylase
MLDKGEIDVAYGVLPRHTSDFGKIDRYGGAPIVGNQRLRKLFPDGGRQIITDYFRRTGVLPSNHLYVVQSAVLEKAPWVALELFKAFQRSKEISYERARNGNSAYMLFEGRDFKDQAEIFGKDPYPLGVRQNRKMLEILFRGSYEEELTRQPAKIEDIFYPTTLDT